MNNTIESESRRMNNTNYQTSVMVAMTKEALKALKESDYSLYLDFAAIQWKTFTALKNVGFTENQALQILTTQSIINIMKPK